MNLWAKDQYPNEWVVEVFWHELSVCIRNGDPADTSGIEILITMEVPELLPTQKETAKSIIQLKYIDISKQHRPQSGGAVVQKENYNTVAIMET